MSAQPPPLALTMGEPAGIGGELTLKAWLARDRGIGPFFAVDDPQRLSSIAVDLGLDAAVETIDHPDQAAEVFRRAVPVLPLSGPVAATPGRPDPATAGAVQDSIRDAVHWVRQGRAAAVVTNPIQKDVMYAAGFRFPGHTEYLAALVDDRTVPVMMLASPDLRVVPVTGLS